MAYELDTDLALERIGPNRFAGMLTDRWTTIAQPNGGYVLGFGIEALAASLPHPDPLSLSAHFLRPGRVGPVEVVVEVIRVGRSVSTASAALVQDGKETMRVLATFADLAATESPRFRTASPPELPPIESLPAGFHPAGGPPIAHRYAHRMTPESFGWLRGAPSGVAEKRGYLAFADGKPPTTRALPVLADSLPPVLPNVLRTAFTPTVELAVQVRAVPSPGPIRARFVTRELAHGYFEEDGELWDAAGELVALSRQVMKYFAP